MAGYKLRDGIVPTIGDVKLMKRIMNAGEILDITPMMERYIEVENGTIDDLPFEEFDNALALMLSRFQAKNPNSKGQ